MWNSEKSAKLSLYLTDLFAVLLIVTAIFLPKIIGWYITYTGKSEDLKVLIITVCYTCFPAAAILLYSLRRLLKNIMKDIIFVPENTKLLRIISWCCVAASIITLVTGYFYMPFYIIGIAAGFFALILRVIKNVFSAAIDIKTENELTI